MEPDFKVEFIPSSEATAPVGKIADVQRAANPCPAWEDGQHFYQVRFNLVSMVDVKTCACGEAVKQKLWWPARPADPEAATR